MAEGPSRPPPSSQVVGHWARAAADRTQEQGTGSPPRRSRCPLCRFHDATEPGWPEGKEGWDGKGQSRWLGWAVRIDPEDSHRPALPVQGPAWGLAPVLGQPSVERWLLWSRAGGPGGNAMQGPYRSMKEKRKHPLGPVAKRDQHRTRVPTRGLRLSALVHEVELGYSPSSGLTGPLADQRAHMDLSPQAPQTLTSDGLCLS